MTEEWSVHPVRDMTEDHTADEEIRWLSEVKKFGGDSEEVTPVPMPNTVVKLFCADGSWGIPPARVGRCQAIKHNPKGYAFLVS